MASVRIGIAVFALPLSVLSVLIATSRYYELTHVIPLPVPLLIICAGLLLLASYLILCSLFCLRHQDRLLKLLKGKDSSVAALIR